MQQTQILLHIRAISYSLSLFSIYFRNPNHKKQFLLHRKHKFYYISMAQICSKINVFCIGHHMNKFSFKYFLQLNLYTPVLS